jgi:phenylalanyl-tRNA synthetase beta chain
VPVSTLSAGRLRGLLPLPVSDLALDDLLFASKAEIEEREGDELTLSVTPDRLDLLSEGGLSLYLAGQTDAATGLPHVRETARGPSNSVVVDRSVAGIRPFIACVTLHAPDAEGIDEGTLAEAIRFQELLHSTIGRGRRAASLGIYPLERIELPIRYSLEPVSDVRFVPLDGTEEVGGEEFFAGHPMAAQYGDLGRVDAQCLTLRDAKRAVLSLPPILNGRSAGELRVGDRDVLLEATGTRERAVLEAVGLLLVVFVARGWSVAPVAATRVEGAVTDGTAVYRPRPVVLPSAVLRQITGDPPMPSGEVEHRLARARLSARPHAGGWLVEAPSWRPDLLTAVDVAEDVVLSAPVRPEDGLLLPSRTRGRRLAEGRFRRRTRTALLGLGFAEPHTPLLVSAEAAERAGSLDAIRLRNPTSAEYSVLRDRLLLSHLEVLRRNTRHAYPQRFAEVGPVIVRSGADESGGETRYHASAIVAADSAGFADAASVVDYLLRTMDVLSVREAVDLPATIPGRAALARVAGDRIAEMGEIHPRILEALGVPVPVAWAEVDLTGLWTLVRRDSH